jgi:hypothetical protein
MDTTRESHKRMWETVYKELHTSTILFTKSELNDMLTIVRSGKEEKHSILSRLGCSNQHYYNVRKKYSFQVVGGFANLVRKKDVTYNPEIPIPVLTSKEEIFDIIQESHIKTNHCRDSHKLYLIIKQQFSNIPRESISAFIRACKKCNERKRLASPKPEAVRPILSSLVNERAQIDLIDMRSEPDGPYKWIMRFADHFSCFYFSAPLKTKSSSEVANALLPHLLTFGAPSILQCDNGTEFLKNTITLLNTLCPETKIVRGRPRHPRSQGLIERSNEVFKSKLASFLEENPSMGWAKAHMFVTAQMNRQPHSGRANLAPFEIVFGTQPAVNLKMLHLPDSLIRIINTESQLMKFLEMHNQGKECTASDLEQEEQDQDQDQEQIQDQDQDQEQTQEQEQAEHTDLQPSHENLAESNEDCSDPEVERLIYNEWNDDYRAIKRRKIITKASEGQKAQADRMLRSALNHTRKPLLDIGDVVMIDLGRGVRGALDPPRLTCVVIDRNINANRYRLCTSTSHILEKWYDRGSLRVCNDVENIGVVQEFPDLRNRWERVKGLKHSKEYSEIVVSELHANRLLSSFGGYRAPRPTCRCSSDCGTKRCVCFNAAVPCHSKCHGFSNTNCKRK